MDRLQYDRDMAQRDRTREFEARARSRDRALRNRDRPVSPVKPRPRSRSPARSHQRSVSPPKHTSPASAGSAPVRPAPSPKARGSRDRSEDSVSGASHAGSGSPERDLDPDSSESPDSPAADGGSLTYAERIALVRLTFQEESVMKENPPEQRKIRVCAGTGSIPRQSKASSSLPFHTFRDLMFEENQGRLLGTHSSKKQKDSAPLPVGRYLKRAEVKSSFYKVTGVRAPKAAPVPESFHALQFKQTEHVGVSYSATETEELETTLRQCVSILSHQDWFLGAGRTLLQEIVAHPETASEVAPKALSLILSAARAGMDLQAVNSTSLHNMVLRRRDGFLATTDKSLPALAKKELRRHDLNDPFLFGAEACAAAHRSMLDSATLKAAVSGDFKKSFQPQSSPRAPAKKGNNQAPASNWSPPKTQKSSPRQWEKKKASGSPKGNSSSFSQKRGGVVAIVAATASNHTIISS